MPPALPAVLLALLMALAVWGVFAGVRMYRAEAKLPDDLALADRKSVV